MSKRRERRASENQNPLIGIKDYFDSENTPRPTGKKNGKVIKKKNSKGQSKGTRKPLGELQSNSVDTHGSFPEIPVKLSESGCLEVDTEKKEIAIQTESCATSSDKMTQTKSIHEQMCTDEIPPPEYWEMLAEQRRKALIEALEENRQLYEQIEELKAVIKEKEYKCEVELPYFALFHKTICENGNW